MDSTLDSVKRAIESQKEYNKAIESGQRVIEGQAKAGMARAPGRRQLLAAGGQSAVDAAESLEASDFAFADGAGNSIVQKAFAKYGDSPKARQAIQSAKNLVQAGLSPGEAEAAVDGGSALGSAESAGRMEARIYHKATGGKYATAQANLQVRGRDANGNIYSGGARGDALIGAANADNTIRSGINNVNEQAAIKDNGNSARSDLARATNPVMAAIMDMQQAREEQMAGMRRLAAAENVYWGALKNMGMMFGGEGSAEQNLRRQQKAFGQD